MLSPYLFSFLVSYNCIIKQIVFSEDLILLCIFLLEWKKQFDILTNLKYIGINIIQ